MVNKNRGFYLPEELLEKLERKAEEEYTSVNSIVRKTLHDMFEVRENAR